MWTTLLSVVLVINELMASNAGEFMSPAINFDSWIELYNPSDQIINLSGMYLSDDENNLTKWQMPQTIGYVPAKGYKVIWLGSNDIVETQASFKLNCDGGNIILCDRNENIITSVTYPKALSRTAYARIADGDDEWSWTAYPTPEATNTISIFATERLTPPIVNVDSKLFTSRFNINVEIPEGATLLYTTDGSVPTAEQGTEGIKPNGTSIKSTTGTFTIKNTTNYVFRLFKEGFLPSIPVTRSYILNDKEYTIPVVSIVGDETYFSDPKIGIDCDGDGTNGKPGNGQDYPRNYNMDWDRPVNFSYISPTDGMLFNQDVNISVSGGWTRSINPRSMKLKSNKVFDGLNHLDYVFFPQKPYIRNKVLLLRNGGNDVWNNRARFTDVALTTVIQRSGIDLDVQSFVQVAEFVNGRFKGIMNLREPNNDKYVYANYGYDDEEIDMFENKKFKNGTDEAYERICEMSVYINRTGTYEDVRKLLDIDEFCNYMAAELYLGNDDWPENNVKAYRNQADGRFRFICFDLDYAFNPWDRDNFNKVLDDHNDVKMVKLFINMLRNDTFRRRFIDTFCLMGGSVFERERAIAIVDELANTMRPMSQIDGLVPDNAARKIKDKLSNRLDDMMNRLQQYSPMKLSGTKKQSVALTTDTEGASLYINGLEVPYASFNGRLFAPVTLEAKAPAGYAFTGWRKGASATNQIIKADDTWKYYDKGEPADNWYSGSFNDNGWSAGEAPLGYTMTGVKTTVSYGSDASHKNPTTYFRKIITLPSTPTRSDIFLLNYQVDDGFVIYVNGNEVGRYNMPDGNISFNSFSRTYAGDTPLTGTLEISSSYFKSGKNIIAVEIHNNSYTSSDQFWAAELFTTLGTTAEGFISTESIIDLPNDNALSLVACFTPLSDEECREQGFTPVRINEVSAANGIYINDYFKRNDWVELYNTTGAEIDVEGMYLSDNPNKPKKYQITGNEGISTVIPAHGYLVIWCDKLEPQTQLHADFKLASEGGDVILTAKDESWSDQLTYAQMNADQTVGRYPDGAADVVLMNVPTIARANITSSYTTIVPQNDTGIHDIMTNAAESLSIHYATGGLTIRSAVDDDLQVRITNLAGQTVATLPAHLSGGFAEISVGQLHVGVYIASVTDRQGHKATCKFIMR